VGSRQHGRSLCFGIGLLNIRIQGHKYKCFLLFYLFTTFCFIKSHLRFSQTLPEVGYSFECVFISSDGNMHNSIEDVVRREVLNAEMRQGETSMCIFDVVVKLIGWQ